MKIRTIMLGIVLSMMFSVHARATQPPAEEPSLGKPDINTKWQIWLGMGVPETGSPAAGGDDMQNAVSRILNFNLSKSNKIRICNTMTEPKCVTYIDLAIKVKNRCYSGTDVQMCKAAVEEAQAFYEKHTNPVALASSAAAKNLARSPRGERVAEGAGSPNPKRASQEIKLQRAKTPTTAVEGSKSPRRPAIMGTGRKVKGAGDN
jgi:hypothetical protein